MNSNSDDSESAISEDVDQDVQNLPNNELNYEVAADNYEAEEEPEQDNQGPSPWEVYMQNKTSKQEKDASMDQEDNLGSIFDEEDGSMINIDENVLSGL